MSVEGNRRRMARSDCELDLNSISAVLFLLFAMVPPPLGLFFFLLLLPPPAPLIYILLMNFPSQELSLDCIPP